MEKSNAQIAAEKLAAVDLTERAYQLAQGLSESFGRGRDIIGQSYDHGGQIMVRQMEGLGLMPRPALDQRYYAPPPPTWVG